ncbi:MAG: 30S ribosomal protein S12 methylthiotransferase RimO [Bacillota bacterium]|nr:30S ribosomal protein S12 methylthiotransferase RimO [Bacillota bacterium]
MFHIYIENLGCSKNLVDTETMLGLLDDEFELAEYPEDADIAIINTCSFIHDAQTESYRAIEEYSAFKTDGILKYLIITGCLSQLQPGHIFDHFPAVDGVVGTGSFFRIVDFVKVMIGLTEPTAVPGLVEYEPGHFPRKWILMDSVDIDIPEGLPRIMTTPRHFAYLKIAEGCDNRCTYCMIPKLRGKFRSRRMEDLVEEAADLAKLGVRELILIAQDTSRYGIDLYGAPRLGELLKKLNDVAGIRWIRVHYLYPDLLDENLIQTMLELPKVVNYFDIPIQHASNAVLKRMNRKTSREDIERVIRQIRAYPVPSIIRTTVIVGFPGETEQDFEELLDFIGQAKFDRLGAFTYSNVPEVPAYRMPDQIDEEIKQFRQSVLMEKQMMISEEQMERWIGESIEVVIEEYIEDEDLYIGRSSFDAPEIDGEVYVKSMKPLDFGDFIVVSVKDSMEYDLVGEYDEHSK